MKIEDIYQKLTEAEKAFLAELIEKDPLTRASNLRKFEHDLTAEVERVNREGRYASLLKVDIDGFKQVNDTRGYEEGNRVLMGVVNCLIGKLRPYNREVYRLSGGADEFAVLVPNTTLEQGGLVAERLRASIEKSDLEVTVSVGVANYIGSCDTREDLVKYADEALQQAKKAGKNQVRSWERERE